MKLKEFIPTNFIIGFLQSIIKYARVVKKQQLFKVHSVFFLFTVLIFSFSLISTPTTITTTTPSLLYNDNSSLLQQAMAGDDDNKEEEKFDTTATTSTTTISTSTTNNFKTYENSTYGVKIKYPSDWIIEELEYYPDDRITEIVTIWAPFETHKDKWQESVKISEDPIPYKADLKKYLDEAIDTYDNNQDFELIESNTNSKLFGLPAYSLIYSYTYTGENEENDDAEEVNYDIKAMEIGTIIDNKAYYINFWAEEDLYPDYLATVQNMINSFEITNTPNTNNIGLQRLSNNTTLIDDNNIENQDANDGNDDVEALYNKGNTLFDLERYTEAIEYYDKALSIDPNDVDALNNKGVSLYNLGRYSEAIEYYDKALSIDPNYALALNNKGNALDELNKKDTPSLLSDKNGMVSYENPKVGIKLQYPSNWQTVEGDVNTSYNISFFPSSPKDDIPIAAFVDIIVYNTNAPLDEFVESYINSISTLPEFTLLESNPTTTIVGNSLLSQMIVFQFTDPQTGISIEELDVIVIKDNKVYNFAYAAEQSKYSTYLPTVLDILKSIEFTSIYDDSIDQERQQQQQQQHNVPLRQG